MLPGESKSLGKYATHPPEAGAVSVHDDLQAHRLVLPVLGLGCSAVAHRAAGSFIPPRGFGASARIKDNKQCLFRGSRIRESSGAA